jgi:murein DD-endopeptidase MepM/ murein hydrolase activator NlpD
MAGTIQAVPPLPIRQDWAPSYLAARAGAVNRDFAFRFADAQGAPSSDGRRYHSAVDWFAPKGTAVLAPRAGVVIRAFSTGDISGPVYGGIVEVEEANGTVWVMRHVVPSVPLGRAVEAGEPVATVSPWTDGSSHLHLEVWRSKAGGYRHENMLDPLSVEWTAVGEHGLDPEPEAAAYFEELPHTAGGAGPAIVGQAKGYSKSTLAKAVAATLRLRGHLVSTVRGDDDRFYVLSWLPGTYGARFRFGPWEGPEAAGAVRRAREANTGRPMRPFTGRARSLYPWPKAG